ncbi:MAG: hypothetical protein IK088_09020 [Lachnospiraceae bacterium]|nr:hypothetical protein [Lachnospiraceae bacterium]
MTLTASRSREAEVVLKVCFYTLLYTERMTRKLMIYESAGIWPGDGLLSSYETSQQPLNTRLLDEMIRKYLM